jgi:hypothetical protein
MREMRRMSKKYYVESARGSDFVIELPDDFEVTFATINPTDHAGRGLALRVYEKVGSKKFQRACYTDVKGFRDLSIPLMRKVERQTGNSEWTSDSEGNFSERLEVKKDYELKPGDVEEDVEF